MKGAIEKSTVSDIARASFLENIDRKSIQVYERGEKYKWIAKRDLQ